MGWFNEQEENVVYAPKQGGEPITVTFKDLVREDCPDDKGYKNKDKNSTGYRDIFVLADDKKLICNVWKLYFAIQESGAMPGDTVKIGHPDRGVYTVEVLKSEDPRAKEEVAWDE